ncbi:GA module-containing protein, partial [Mycoplasmopsis pullorum]
QLTNLDANQRKQLKDKIVTFDDYEKAAALVNNAQTINDAIKKLEEKIADANTAKADEVYTLDEQTKKTVFDTALSHANDKLSEYKNLNLTTLDNDSTTTKKAQIEKEVSDLDTEINKLDGYRHAFKESLKGKWHLLTDNDLAPLNAMVDKPDFPEKPEAVNKEEVWNEGLRIAKTKATEKLNSTTYNNLSAADLQTLKTEATPAALNSNAQNDTNQKFDDAVKAILDKAQEQNQAKQEAMNAIDALDNLTSEQKTKWKEKVKADVVAQAQNIKNDATALDTAIKALKDEVLSELKQLSKNPTLDADSMFSADKIADKYKLADANLKTEYDKQLASVQTLISKVDVTKDEIQTAKSTLNTAFSALNGDNKLSELEKEIDKLTNLSDDQRTKLKESITNAETQDKASEIVNKARELNTKIGDLKAKIQEAKDKQNDSIYTKDTQNKKSTFDEAIKAA